MLKVTSIPIILYNSIIDYIKSNNHDSIFYAWPGKLLTAYNEILLFVNLDRPNLQKFLSLVKKKSSLCELVVKADYKNSNIDDRIFDLFGLINEKSGQCPSITIEPPFLFQPYLNLDMKSFPRIEGRPVIPIGDTIMVGNPKVGNGLENHLKHVRYIHDTFLYLLRPY